MGKLTRITTAMACCILICWQAYSNGNPDKRTVKANEHREDAVTRLIESSGRWFGVYELTGNNDHPMITKAMKLCGLRGDKGYPWCAAAMTDIHYHANIPAPKSARVVDWFKNNVVWERKYGPRPVYGIDTKGMVGALYYQHLGRYGHIVLIIGEDKNNFYTLEGNTNVAGSREGDGFYKKVRSKESIAALADYCVTGNDFITLYDNYLRNVLSK